MSLILRAGPVDQKLGCGLEGVRTDGEDRVLALLVLPELGADASEQHAEPERLGDVVVGARLQPENRVGIRGLRRQHDDRAFEAAAAKQLAGFAPVEIGKADIEEDEVDMAAARLLQALGRGGRQDRVELLMQAELLAQGLAKLVVIVDDEDLAGVAHRWPLACFALAKL